MLGAGANLYKVCTATYGMLFWPQAIVAWCVGGPTAHGGSPTVACWVATCTELGTIWQGLAFRIEGWGES